MNSLPESQRRPILITEFGIDRGVLGLAAQGWRNVPNLSATAYVNQLRYWLTRMPSSVAAMFLYCSGGVYGWSGFEVAGVPEIESLMQEVVKVASLQEQFAAEYQAWVAAGGITNNFRKHLIGIGRIQPTADDLRMLAAECGASVAQMQAAIARFPFR